MTAIATHLDPHADTHRAVRTPGRAARSAAVDVTAGTPSRGARWGGRVLSGLALLFLLFDAIAKLTLAAPAVKGTQELGYQVSSIRSIGILQLILVALYAYPRTAILGAILWTGYLGGAVATHVRVGNPLLSHVLFPTYVAAILWVGLWLRDLRLRALVPTTRRPR
jgi:hypothetical protein